MEQKTNKPRKLAAFIFLLLLAPVMGELLSGSAPPNEFFTPFGFLIITLLYGGGALLIREMRVKWKLGFSIVFLAIAYGILEEGLLMQSFFNHHHADLDALAKYGLFLKCHWPWSIELTIYHATISTLLPIMATDLLFPDLKDEPLLKKGGTITFSVLLVLETIFMALLITTATAKLDDPYIADAGNIFVWTAITIGLIYLAYHFRGKRHVEEKAKLKSPFAFTVTGFFFAPILIITPYVLAENSVPAIITTALLVLYIFIVLRFYFRQMHHRDITAKHRVYLFAGVITSFTMLAIFNEFANDAQGMAATGAVCFVLMLVFAIVVLKRESRNNEQ